MDEKDFKLIDPLTERPVLPRSEKLSLVEKVVLEFANSDYKYAALKNELVREFKNANGCARAIGRVVSSLKKKGVIKENIRVYSLLEKVYLEKL